MKFLALTTMTAIGFGCAAVGPDYVGVEITTPATYTDRDAESVEADAISFWWTVFEDPQLNALVDQALGANLDLMAAVERIEFARATYGIARADRLPAVDGRGSFSRGRPLVGTPTQDQWSVGAAAAWEIDLFGRVRRSNEAALAGFEAQVEAWRGVRVAVAAETVATYLQIRSIQERLAIAAENVEGQERSQSIADDRFGAGMAAALDPTQARVNLLSTRAIVPQLELFLRRALHRLSVLTGREPSALRLELLETGPLPEVPESLLVGVPADLLRNRPDIRAMERQLASQTARVGVAIAARYPALQLSGTWDWLTNEPEDLLDGDFGLGGIGPAVSIPIFDGDRRRSSVSAEEAELRRLDLELRQRVLIAQEEVENALVAIVQDRARAGLLRDAVSSAQRSVGLSRQLYTSGQADFQNVLDAQRSQFALEDELASVRLDVLLDLVDLYVALGGGWDPGRTPALRPE